MIHKKDIARQVAVKHNMSESTVIKIIQTTLDTIIDTVIKKGRLELRNFGVFMIKQRKARKARNPKTGEKLMAPAKKVIVFKSGHHIKKKLAKI
ncbi:MAG: HU family DNA-binding protein [Candidatus Brocadiia bacterium]